MWLPRQKNLSQRWSWAPIDTSLHRCSFNSFNSDNWGHCTACSGVPARLLCGGFSRDYAMLPLSLSAFLCRWGRPSKQNVPLKGTILLLCGATLSFALFPEEIACASIAVVAFGDSVATAIGILIGRHKLPYSENKTIEGTLSGMIAAFLVASFFVTPVQAFIGSAGGMLLESVINLQTTQEFNSQMIFKFFLNDNFLIPLFSGLLMFIII